MIADMVNREMSAEQISILNSLLDSAITHSIHGVDVVIADVSLDYYVGDFALLAHKLLEMENIRVLLPWEGCRTGYRSSLEAERRMWMWARYAPLLEVEAIPMRLRPRSRTRPLSR